MQSLPIAFAEALFPEAAGDSAPKHRSVLPSLYCYIIIRVLDPDSSMPLAGCTRCSAHLLPCRAVACTALLRLLMIETHELEFELSPQDHFIPWLVPSSGQTVCTINKSMGSNTHLIPVTDTAQDLAPQLLKHFCCVLCPLLLLEFLLSTDKFSA